MTSHLKFVAACSFALLPVANVHAQTEAKTRLVPLFSNVERSPAFMVECKNESPAAIGALELIQGLKYRVDGIERRETGGIAGSFMGGEPFLEPMQTWRIMVGIRQGNYGTMSADLGAILRSPWRFPLAPGRHTLAIRCVESWSDEVEFYWESATLPR